MKLTILGTGTSHGVPVIGCSCAVCTSSDSRDKRMRCSLYIEGIAGERAIIDTGPEFRLQALRAGITGLDAVFLTHAHADHIHGLDDIRPLCKENPIPIYGNDITLSEFHERFSYIFKTTQAGGGKPHIKLIKVHKPVTLGSLVFTPIPVKHGNIDILGWKISKTHKKSVHGKEGGQGSAVYITDSSFISDESFNIIAKGGPPELAIIGGLRLSAHETHFSFEQALHAGITMKAKQIYLTHICHSHSHKEINDYCQKFTRNTACKSGAAWDGFVAEI